MPKSPFLFIKSLVGIVCLFSSTQWVDLTYICNKATSLLAIVIEIILSCLLRLWSINWPAVLKRLIGVFPFLFGWVNWIDWHEDCFVTEVIHIITYIYIYAWYKSFTSEIAIYLYTHDLDECVWMELYANYYKNFVNYSFRKKNYFVWKNKRKFLGGGRCI